MNRIDAAYDAITRQLRECSKRATLLRDSADETSLTAPPSAGAWSAAACIEHLSRSTEAFLPLLDAAAGELRRAGTTARRVPRRDFVGWMLTRTLEPPARMRTKTAAPFIPEALADAGAVFARFEERQQELIAIIEASRGLPLDRARVNSPFDQRIRYSAWSALHVLAAHQRRHLWQAERAVHETGHPAAK